MDPPSVVHLQIVTFTSDWPAAVLPIAKHLSDHLGSVDTTWRRTGLRCSGFPKLMWLSLFKEYVMNWV